MSMIGTYSHDVDDPQEVEEEVPPFPQNFFSPFLDENQLFFGTMAADHQAQQTNLELISNEPLPGVDVINMKAAQEIFTNTSRAGRTHLHSEPSDHSNKMKKISSFNRGSTARKSGKKDRHSKINTAQGVRDRRMRLSLQIAREFFDLQDMLGYDKASKTIDWLFSKSKKAIKQLNCSPSHIPQTKNEIFCRNGSRGGEKSEQKRKLVKTAKKSVTSRNTKCIAKELRDKARARARERTREKMMIRCPDKSNYNNFCDDAYNMAQLGPAEYPNTLFEIGQASMSNYSSSQDNTWTSQSSLHRQLANVALFGASTASSSSGSVFCSMYNYDEKIGNNVLTGELDSFFNNNLCNAGNWDITSEYSNPNYSINFQENPGYQFQYSDHNQVE